MSMNGMTIRGARGGNARNGKTTFPHVVARQERAKARLEISSKRTPEEQLKRLDAAGLPAMKERAKLAARIIAREEAKKQATNPPKSANQTDKKQPKFKKPRVAKGQASGSPATE